MPLKRDLEFGSNFMAVKKCIKKQTQVKFETQQNRSNRSVFGSKRQYFLSEKTESTINSKELNISMR